MDDISQVARRIQELEAHGDQRRLAELLASMSGRLHERRSALCTDSELAPLYGRLYDLVMGLRHNPAPAVVATLGAGAETQAPMARAEEPVPGGGPNTVTGSNPAIDLGPSGPPTAGHMLSGRLRDVWQRHRNEPDARPYAAAFETAAAPSDAVGWWKWLHLLALRLPVKRAAALLSDAWHAAEEVAREADLDHGEALGALTDDVRDRFMISSLPLIDYAGEAWETPEPCPESPALALFAKVATRMLQLAAVDPAVRCGYSLAASTDSQLTGFTDDNREQYRGQLRQALKALSRGEPKPIALVDVDEAARGVVPVPLPALDSWWSNTLDELEEALTRSGARMPQIRSPYSGAGRARRDVQLELTNAGARPVARGEIAWVLRAELPGDDSGFTSDKDLARSRVVYLV